MREFIAPTSSNLVCVCILHRCAHKHLSAVWLSRINQRSVYYMMIREYREGGGPRVGEWGRRLSSRKPPSADSIMPMNDDDRAKELERRMSPLSFISQTLLFLAQYGRCGQNARARASHWTPSVKRSLAKCRLTIRNNYRRQ